MVVTLGWWLVGPKARGEGSDSEVSLPWIVSEAVSVDGVRAKMHQLVNPLGELLVNGLGAGLDGFETVNRLLSAVRHVDDELMIGDEGEAVVHGLVGLVVGGRCSSHVSKICGRGLAANPLKLKRI